MNKIKDPRIVIKFLIFANTLLKEKSWTISQYILESLIALVTKIASSLGPTFEEDKISQENSDLLYSELTHIISSILLFHRHRINGRHHLIIKTFISLISCLAKRKSSKSKTNQENDSSLLIPWLSTPCSVKGASDYSRLLSNLCEPPVQAIREKGGANNLVSSSAQAKRALAKHLMPLLLAYVYYGLHYTFVADIRDILSSGFYVLFDIMGADQLKTANAAMDGPSRVYFKALYDDYKKHGKWSDE
ncbi:hypothetical protein NADFUDRAFT_81146 [Nadsonia fulvescens var. elongata DSM 6958]|uniref:Nucleolar 27S pre-rRNA processing Urb2/Npa2 C-terminal domain-containing protein n=1 Tax=Nadsonia fulvescens var. elongata DSM 6958 TaxID=857566 RepID=A0A1E3PRL0_9ASCO|nr:hypothetical protein NADFUDRAFT_81146 [Nadsonia fulvescens var. elongata DSM 6958]